MKKEENLCERFKTIIPLMLVSCVAFPHKSHENIKNVINNPQTDEHVKRVCEFLLKRIVKYGTKDGVPTSLSLERAARYMGDMQGNDDFIRFAGLCLQMILLEMEDPKES